MKTRERDKIMNDSYSLTSEHDDGIISKTSEITKSKISIENIITSPPIIRTKPKDKLNDLLQLSKKTGGGEIMDNKSKLKKSIKVTKHKNNVLSEKFDQVESFYDNMIKI